MAESSTTIPPADIERVRRFNRTVTQSVGALQDRYLSRDRPLGEARLLWEIGTDGCDVRELRSRLDLDSGYVSRLLQSLAGAGLVTVEPSPHDRRVRTARLTAAGRREWATLDRRSDELAGSLLAPLGTHQRDRLVEAMDTVDRLLTAALVRTEIADPGSPAARHCLAAYFAELNGRFDSGFDPEASLLADHSALRPPGGAFLLATLHGTPVGCGAIKLHGDRTAEVKRLWVSPDARGLGLGRRLLAELEALATEHGARRARLDTNRTLTEAIALYRSAGWSEVERFNDEIYAHHWFEKRLTPRRRTAARAPARTRPPARTRSRASAR